MVGAIRFQLLPLMCILIFNPFKTAEELMGPKLRARRVCASLSEVYPAGKLQWHFTCGFGFSLWLPFVAGFAVLKGLLIVPLGTMGSFEAVVNPFKAVGELMDCVQSQQLGARAPRLPRCILLGGFMIAICSQFCSSGWVINSSCGDYGFFWSWDLHFRGREGDYGLCTESRSRRARSSPSEVYLAGKLQWLGVLILDIVCDCHL